MSKIFISYARKDSAFVVPLIRDIEDHDLDVWVDREDIYGGAAWQREISLAIRGCRSMVVVLSPNAVSSRNVMKELSLADGHEKPIIPVMYQQCSIPPEAEYQLAGLQIVDFSYRDRHTALGELLEALGSKRGLRARTALTSSERRRLILSEVLPGIWQVQLNMQTPFGYMPSQVMIEVNQEGFFNLQAQGFVARGQWGIPQFNQLFLNGQQSNGFMTLPYQVVIQFTNVSLHQLSGITTGSEVAFWQRVR